ncbi:unnamed protein product [Victoria cruziana]
MESACTEELITRIDVKAFDIVSLLRWKTNVSIYTTVLYFKCFLPLEKLDRLRAHSHLHVSIAEDEALHVHGDQIPTACSRYLSINKITPKQVDAALL